MPPRTADAADAFNNMRREKLIRVLPFFSETTPCWRRPVATNSWTECLIAASACGGNIGLHTCSGRAGAPLSRIDPGCCACPELASKPYHSPEEIGVSL